MTDFERPLEILKQHANLSDMPIEDRRFLQWCIEILKHEIEMDCPVDACFRCALWEHPKNQEGQLCANCTDWKK